MKRILLLLTLLCIINLNLNALTMKEFVDYQAKAVPEDMLSAAGIQIEVPEEMKAEFMKQMAKPMPSNPIELY